MSVPSVNGANASVMWAYERWNAATPDVTVTGRVAADAAVASVPPNLVHRVDTWQPGSVSSDWTGWYDKSAWSASAVSAAEPQSDGALTAPVQQFIVNPGPAALSALSPQKVAGAVVQAVGVRLGLTAAGVTARLDAGQSLASIATQANVRHSDLVNVIRAALPDLQDPVLQTSAAEQLADASGPVDLSALQLPAASGGDGTQVLAISLDATASLLSTTPAALMQQLSQGTSLSAIASAGGVAHADLIDAVQSDLPPQTPGWPDRAALAEQVAGDTGSSTEQPPAPVQQFVVDPGGGPEAMTMSLTATASLLSTTPAALMDRLSQGASLNAIADGLGVTHDDLVGALETDLPAQTPGWSDVTALAEQLAAGTSSTTIGLAAPAPPSTGQQFLLDSGDGPQPLTMYFDATARLLSTTPSDLMDQLSQGASLNAIADGLGVSRSDLNDALITDLPAQTPGWSDVTALADQLAAATSSTTIGPTGPDPVAPTTGQQFLLDAGNGPQPLTMFFDATARLLSTTPSDLMDQLSQGASLNAIADGLGVSRSDLNDALITDLPAQTPGWSDVTALAEQLAATTDSTTTPLA